MTRSADVPAWAKAALAAGAVLGLCGTWMYLAGGLFLLANGHQLGEATPTTFYQYWYYADQHTTRTLYIAGGVAAALLLGPLALLFAPAKRSLYGDARFASMAEVRRAGLFGDKGLLVGRIGKRYLMFPGQQHVYLSAPTRSKKGVSIVIPNLLLWPDSVVVVDIKKENWDITSGFRAKHGQACYLFNPGAQDYKTHRYNPLAYVRSDPVFQIDDVQKIANMLFPDQPNEAVIWTATPRSLFMGIVLYLMETPGKPVTLGQVLRETLEDGDGSVHFAGIINARAEAGNPLSSACVRALNAYVSIASENTRSGIIGGFRSRLELWMNPLVDAATSGNDFDLRDLRRRRMSIYLAVTPDNLVRMAPLLNLFFQQLLDLNTRELPQQDKTIKYDCLLLPDEFTAIGRIPAIAKGIGFIAGYRLRMLPVTQSPSQIVEVYGRDAAQTFQTNHAMQIVFAPKASETQTARDISEWLGYQTVKGKSVSQNKYLFAKRTPTESTSDQRRALLLPQEITGIGGDRELIILEDTPPILARKAIYYSDPVFMDRLKSVSPGLRALGRKLPSKEQLEHVVMLGELAAPVAPLDIARHMAALNERPTHRVTPPRDRRTESLTVERPVGPADLPNLSRLNFALDFSGVQKPAPGALDERALNEYADNLCRAAGLSV